MTDAQVPNFPQDERITNAAGVNAVQSIAVHAKKGKFTVTFEGVKSAELNAATLTAAELKTVLEGLSESLVNNIVVTGGPANAGGTTPFVVEFVNAQAKRPVGAITAASVSLEEGTPGNEVVITQTVVGTEHAANATQKGTGLADRTGEANPLLSESPAEKRTNHSGEFD